MAFSMVHQVSRVHNQGVIWYFNDSHVTEWIYMRLKLSKWVTKCACIHVRAWNTPVCIVSLCDSLVYSYALQYIYGTPPRALRSLCISLLARISHRNRQPPPTIATILHTHTADYCAYHQGPLRFFLLVGVFTSGTYNILVHSPYNWKCWSKADIFLL